MPNTMPRPYGVYPGGMGKDFGPAAWQFAQDMSRSVGGPYAAAASDSAASDFYASPNNFPSFSDMITGASTDAFRQARLGSGLANANTAGVQATNRNRNAGIQGSQSNTNAFASNKYADYASQMGLQFAKNQATDQNIGIFGQLAKPFFGAGGMLTGGPGSPGAIPQIIGGSGGMPNLNIFSSLLGSGGLAGLFSGGGAGIDAAGLGTGAAIGGDAIGAGAGATTAAGGFASLLDFLPFLAAA